MRINHESTYDLVAFCVQHGIVAIGKLLLSNKDKKWLYFRSIEHVK